MDGNVIRITKNERGQIKKFVPKKTAKLRKDGEVKQTPCNSKENRDNVYPFKEEDIPKMIAYFQLKIDNSPNKDDELVNRRNLAMFIMGINIGLRVSDLLSLRWSDIYDKNWEFLSGKKIKPIKTQRTNKHVLLKYNDSFKRAIEEYRQHLHITNMDGYIFKSREGQHIQPQMAGKVIKNAALEIGIKYNVNTHSMRKTKARVIYDHSVNKEEALIGIMTMFGHSSIRITKDYLCITEEEIDELNNRANLGYEIIEE